jgi:hypothetical protein
MPRASASIRKASGDKVGMVAATMTLTASTNPLFSEAVLAKRLQTHSHYLEVSS